MADKTPQREQTVKYGRNGPKLINFGLNGPEKTTPATSAATASAKPVATSSPSPPPKK